jgi:hypothetical protein
LKKVVKITTLTAGLAAGTAQAWDVDDPERIRITSPEDTPDILGQHEPNEQGFAGSLKKHLFGADTLYIRLPFASDHSAPNDVEGLGGLAKGEEYDEVNPGLLLGAGWKNVARGTILEGEMVVYAGIYDNSYRADDHTWSHTAFAEYYPDALGVNFAGQSLSVGAFAGIAEYPELEETGMTFLGDHIPAGGLAVKLTNIGSGTSFVIQHMPGEKAGYIDVTTFNFELSF